MRPIGKLTPKKDQGKLSLFCGNVEWEIPIYEPYITILYKNKLSLVSP